MSSATKENVGIFTLFDSCWWLKLKNHQKAIDGNFERVDTQFPFFFSAY